MNSTASQAPVSQVSRGGSLTNRIAALLADIKIAHTVFALPFALLSAHIAFISTGGYRWQTLMAILICMVTARTAAMSFNRYLDRNIDAVNPRTSGRSIPKGRVRPSDAVLIVIFCSVIFIAACAYLGSWPLGLSVPTLAFLLGYSFTKRFTVLTHLWLGVALAISPMGAWLAITGNWNWLPVILSLAVAFWVTGFDIIYSLQDLEFDRKNCVFSIPMKFGPSRGLLITRILHVLSWMCMVYFGYAASIGWPWFAATAMVGIILVIEHSMVRPDDLSRVGFAFFTMNGIISILLYVSTLASSVLGTLNVHGGVQ